MEKQLLILHGAQENSEVGQMQLREKLATRLSIPDETLEEMFSQLPVILKKDLSADEAAAFKKVLEEMGAQIEVRDDGVAEFQLDDEPAAAPAPESITEAAPVKPIEINQKPDDGGLSFDDEYEEKAAHPEPEPAPVAEAPKIVEPESPVGFAEEPVVAESAPEVSAGQPAGQPAGPAETPLTPEEEKAILENAFARKTAAAAAKTAENSAAGSSAPSVSDQALVEEFSETPDQARGSKRTPLIALAGVVLLVGAWFFFSGDDDASTSVEASKAKLSKEQLLQIEQAKKALKDSRAAAKKKAAIADQGPKVPETKWLTKLDSDTLHGRLEITTADTIVKAISIDVSQDPTPERTPEMVVENIKRTPWLKRFTTDDIKIEVINTAVPSDGSTPVVAKENSFSATGTAYVYLDDGKDGARTTALFTIQGVVSADGKQLEGAWRLKKGISTKENSAYHAGSSFVLNYGGTFEITQAAKAAATPPSAPSAENNNAKTEVPAASNPAAAPQ